MFNSRRSQLEKIARRDRMEGESSCLFVGSKGLMKLCETHQPLPNDYAKRWPRAALKSHESGGRIYVHVSALRHFARWSLDRIQSPFVLVSGDADADVSEAVVGAKVMRKILDHPQLIHWHAQNLALDHPKVSPMAIGLDYHTIAGNRRPEWGPSASPRAQEEVLHLVRALSPALSKRRLQGYCNWHFAIGNGDRAEVIKALPEASCYYEPDRVARTASWRRNSGFFFTLSPRGVGMDCHRTWEAILLGSVPVIPDLSINSLFDTLPVVIVQDWETVTPAFLAAERERILESEFDFAPVLLETWRRVLLGREDLPSVRMRYQEFMGMGVEALTEAIA